MILEERCRKGSEGESGEYNLRLLINDDGVVETKTK